MNLELNHSSQINTRVFQKVYHWIRVKMIGDCVVINFWNNNNNNLKEKPKLHVWRDSPHLDMQSSPRNTHLPITSDSEPIQNDKKTPSFSFLLPQPLHNSLISNSNIPQNETLPFIWNSLHQLKQLYLFFIYNNFTISIGMCNGMHNS